MEHHSHRYNADIFANQKFVKRYNGNNINQLMVIAITEMEDGYNHARCVIIDSLTGDIVKQLAKTSFE